MASLGTFSGKLARAPGLTALLGEPVTHVSHARDAQRQRVRAIVGWGLRPSTVKPRAIASKLGLAYVALEDGFLRAFGTGSTHPSLSLVIDASGIYYDATRPSDLESLLASQADVLSGPGARYRQARELIVERRLSKYNFAGDAAKLPGDRARKRILVADQTRGDASIVHGLATERTFMDMLNAARAEHPDALIYVKTHPQVSRRERQGHLSDVAVDDRTIILRDAVNPLALLEQVDHVYVVTSQFGFEALLLGKTVSCFGMPWYAGWGCTDDRVQCARRQRARSVDELFAAAYMHYTRYLDPETHERGTIFDVIDWLSRQRDVHAAQTGRSIAIGFSSWKSVNVGAFLGLDASRTHFVSGARGARRLQPTASDRLVVWGARAPADVVDIAQRSGAALLRMEDGFVRSIGLGADFIAPLSVVLDRRGIYFDARTPSDLETLLATREFSQEDLRRARRVRDLIVENRITKYNVESVRAPAWRGADRRIVLVPGQVEDDASIRYGAAGPVTDNLSLLAAVRDACPDAFVVYKPHPDVMFRRRKGRVHREKAQRHADVVETEVSIASCVAASDEIHTMTSLCGFEGLLHGKRVVTYGRPFYSGWGLTDDRMDNARRQRRLTLEELIAGALLHYPVYWDWTLKGVTTCEAVLGRIIAERRESLRDGDAAAPRQGFLQRQWRKLKLMTSAAGGRRA